VIRPGERSIESFDDDHASAAAWARRRFVVGSARTVVVVGVIRGRRGHLEQTSSEVELVGAVAVGEEAVVTDAMEAARQHVEQEGGA